MKYRGGKDGERGVNEWLSLNVTNKRNKITASTPSLNRQRISAAISNIRAASHTNTKGAAALAPHALHYSLHINPILRKRHSYKLIYRREQLGAPRRNLSKALNVIADSLSTAGQSLPL
jgi:hypothetical protein